MHGNHPIKEKTEASFTVFFALAFLSIIAFWLALIYAANHCLLVTRGRKAADISAHSVLAEYDRAIEKKYGLYCVVNQMQAEENLQYYLEKNAADCKGVGLFPCSLGDLHLTADQSLEDEETIEEQLQKFMEKRIVLSWTDEWAERLGLLQETADRMEETSAQWDRLEEYNGLYIQLVEEVDGIRQDGSATGRGINDHQQEEAIRNLWDQIVESGEDPTALLSEEENLKKKLEEGKDRYQQVILLLEEMERTARDIAGQSLPLGTDQISKLIRQAKEREERLDGIEAAWQQWKEDPRNGEKKESLNERVQSLTETERMEMEYSVITEGTEKINLKELWEAITGKGKTSIEEYAPDKTLLREDDDAYGGLPSELGWKGEKTEEQEETWEASMQTVQQSLKEAGAGLADRLYLTEYIGGMLRSYPETVAQAQGETILNLRMEQKAAGFFENELEYILKGSMNEYQNVKAVRRQIICIRTILNMITLLQDQEKCALIQAAAKGTGGILVPGIGEQVAYGLILIGWSLWEAAEDWDCLAEGGKVPFLKTGDDWKTDLDSLLNQESPGEMETVETGLSYRQYTGLLLYLLPEDTIIKRIQDLIYLEKKGTVPMEQYITGFSVKGELEAGGLTYALSGTYQY